MKEGWEEGAGGGRRDVWDGSVDLEMESTSSRTVDAEEENPNLKTNSARDHALNSNSAYSPLANPTVASSCRVWATKSVLHQRTARTSHGSALGLHTSSADMFGRMWAKAVTNSSGSSNAP